MGQSDVEEREELPQFDPSDFMPADRYRVGNTPDVDYLVEEFEDDPSIRETAAAFCNHLARDAIERSAHG